MSPPPRPDILAGLSRNQRRRREDKDMRYLADHPEIQHRATAETLARFKLGAVFNAENMKLYDADEPVDMIICARLDLEHPLYYDDNVFDDCIDCGANLQLRPNMPANPRICICCAARRARELKAGESQ